MKIKKHLSVFLALVMLITSTLVVAPRAKAATFADINNPSVFLKQQTNYTCTLVSAVMLVRRAAMMNGNSDWSSITENSMRPTAWNEGSGLWYSFSYAGISIRHDTISGSSSALQSLLSSHPEGIVIYNRNQPHAVLLTDFTNGIFYCADPATGDGRKALSSCTLWGNGESGKVSQITDYWYVSSPQVSLSPSFSAVSISQGKYCIINVATQKYLDVLNGGDFDNCNVRVFNGNGAKAQTWNISGNDPARYMLRPECSTDRVLNQYGDTVVSGSNVCLWSNTNDDSQRWAFESVSNGYVIHCAGNPSCVLDVDENGNVCVSNYVQGNQSQIWKLESVTYQLDVNGLLNGANSGNINGFGTFDMYINGSLVGNDINDYCKMLAQGTTWEIKDIKCNGDSVYVGPTEGTLSGTLNKNTGIRLAFNTKQKFSISFNANGGSNAPSAITKTEGTGVNLPTTSPTKACCVFVGWSTSSNATTAQYQPGALITGDSNLLLYAVWKEGQASGWMTTKPSSGDYLTRTEYRYRDQQTAASSSWKQTGSGTIEYVTSWPGGFNTGNNLYTKYNNTPKTASETSTSKVTVSNTQIGWVYWHWCRGTYDQGPINRYISDCADGEFQSFHAFFSATDASAQYDAYEYSNADVCRDTYWYYRVPVYRQTWTSYTKETVAETWGNWSSWSTTQYTASSTRQVETRTVYATITANNVHTWNSGTVTQAATTRAEGVRTFTCTKCGKTRTESIPRLSCSIAYNANGGSGAPSTQTYMYASSGQISLSSTVPTRTGYTFLGWSLSSTATSASYSVGQAWDLSNDGSFTLYAVWKEKTEVRIRPNGGVYNGSSSEIVNQYNYGDVIDLGTPTREGYEFVTWMIDLSDDGHILEPWGVPQWQDPVFTNSYSNVGVYDNNNTGKVTVERVDWTDDAPTRSTKVLRVTSDSAAEPGLGGFVQLTYCRASSVFYHMIVAKIPVGYQINCGKNWIGDGGYQEWITPVLGTGRYETYIYRTVCGSTGSFSNFGFVYLTKADSTVADTVTWDVAYSEVFDATNTGNGSKYTVGNDMGIITALWRKLDTAAPVGTITTTNNAAVKQTVTLTMSDNEGIAGYYWGNSRNYAENTFTATSDTSVSFVVSKVGTYYLTVQDVNGNLSETTYVTFYKTSLDANGGSVSPKYVLSVKGQNAALPVPTREKYDFTGWFTAEEDGTQVTADTTITKSIKLYAHWVKDDMIAPTGSISATANAAIKQYVTLTLSDNKGIAGYYRGTRRDYTQNEFVATSDTTVKFAVTKSGNYYLVVKDTSDNLSEPVVATFCKTTLSANGGTVSPKYILSLKGSKVTLPMPTKTGKYFAGWYTEAEGGNALAQTTKITKNGRIYAHWSDTDILAPICSVTATNNIALKQTVTIKMMDNAGIGGYYWGNSRTYTENTFIATNASSASFLVTKSGNYFLTVVDVNGLVSETVEAVICKTSFDANGGSITPKYTLTLKGDSITLPTPTREGYTFAGWFTAAEGGTRLTDTTRITKNGRVYAQWVSQ